MQIAEGTFKGPRTSEQRREKQIWTFGHVSDEWYEVRKPRIRPATREFYTEILGTLKKSFARPYPAAQGPASIKSFRPYGPDNGFDTAT